MKDMMLSMIQHYGYTAVFVAMMLGIIGLPLPLEFLLLFAATIVSAAKLNFIWLIVFAWLGASAGMAVNYGLGKNIGIKRLSKLTKWVHLSEERLDVWAEKFQKTGPILIVVGFFVAGLRHASPFIAGASNMSFPRFIAFALGGGLLWISAFSFLGEKFGHHWHSIMKITHHPWWLVFGAAVIAAMLMLKKRIFPSISHVRGVK